jgi:hypothetical protein
MNKKIEEILEELTKEQKEKFDKEIQNLVNALEIVKTTHNLNSTQSWNRVASAMIMASPLFDRNSASGLLSSAVNTIIDKNKELGENGNNYARLQRELVETQDKLNRVTEELAVLKHKPSE